MRFTLDQDLLAKLRRYSDEQRRQYREWGGDEHDLNGFLLYSGMGPLIYITVDGRILIDERTWNGDALREADEDEATESVVIGASMTGIDALLDLLTPRPAAAVPCPECTGNRWVTLSPDRGFTGVCRACHGRGWTPDGERLAKCTALD